jgi:hypothetical protein
MEKIYFDWSQRRGIAALFGDTDQSKRYPSLRELLNDLTEPTCLIGEATFESFNLTERQYIIDRCKTDGHLLLTLPTRETTKWRYRLGFGEKPATQTFETDLQDAMCLRAEAKAGAHLKVPGPPDHDFVCVRQEANYRLMQLRSIGTLIEKPRAKGSYNFVPDKDLYAADIIRQLPSFGSLTEVQQIALGKDGNYNPVIVAAVGVCAEFANTRREFDRLSGLYVHAYKSQIRADLMFWAWAGGGPRKKLNKETRKRDDLTLSQYRRELRWLFHQIKALG